MRKRILVALAATGLLAVGVASAVAVTDGEPDGEGHPYVGLMVAQDADGNPLWRCSGTLISPTLYLTAGHCTEAPAAHAEIWFDADVQAGIPGNGYPNNGDVGGTPHTHPQYDPDAFYLFDLGVVVLDQPVAMAEYGKLPELDQLDSLSPKRGQQDVTFTADGLVDEPTLLQSIEIMQRAGEVETPVPIEQAYDLRITRQVVATGGAR